MKILEEGRLFEFKGVKALCLGMADYSHKVDAKGNKDYIDCYLCYTQGLLFVLTHVCSICNSITTTDRWCVTKVFKGSILLSTKAYCELANRDFDVMSDKGIDIRDLEGDWYVIV